MSSPQLHWPRESLRRNRDKRHAIPAERFSSGESIRRKGAGAEHDAGPLYRYPKGANQLGANAVTSPPYEQQGKPLDSSLGVIGWWVEYGYIFLFLPPPNQIFTEVKLETGERCFGINAAELADAFTKAGPFQVSSSDLILNNELGSLSVREEPGMITPGATRAVDFVFGLPYGAQVRAPMKSAPIAGSA
jgi:hypothetical protein